MIFYRLTLTLFLTLFEFDQTSEKVKKPMNMSIAKFEVLGKNYFQFKKKHFDILQLIPGPRSRRNEARRFALPRFQYVSV